MKNNIPPRIIYHHDLLSNATFNANDDELMNAFFEGTDQ